MSFVRWTVDCPATSIRPTYWYLKGADAAPLSPSEATGAIGVLRPETASIRFCFAGVPTSAAWQTKEVHIASTAVEAAEPRGLTMLFGAQKIVIATAFGERKSFYNGSLSRVKPGPYGAFPVDRRTSTQSCETLSSSRQLVVFGSPHACRSACTCSDTETRPCRRRDRTVVRVGNVALLGIDQLAPLVSLIMRSERGRTLQP